MIYLEQGAVAPDFELSGLDGRRMTLTEEVSAGGLALVFFKSSCPTCELTAPYLERIFESFPRERGPGLWGVSQDAEDETAAFVAGCGLSFPVLIDSYPYRVSDAYAIRYVPTLYWIESGGRVELAEAGFSKSALDALALRLARSRGVPPPDLFDPAAQLPEWRAGCASKN